jgi:Fic family protein
MGTACGLCPSYVPLGSALLKQAIAAARELAELKGAGDVIPNQAILINGIVLQEARLSSEIQNIVTTNDELYRAASEDLFNAGPHTEEVLRYREALWHGFADSPRGSSTFRPQTRAMERHRRTRTSRSSSSARPKL